MGIYDRSYMRASSAEGRIRAPRRKLRRAKASAGPRRENVATFALVALLALQLLALAIPTITSHPYTGARSYRWLDAFGQSDFAFDVPSTLLVLPGATIVALLCRPLLGSGRLFGLGILLLGLSTAAVVRRTSNAWAWADTQMEGLLWPAGGGLLKLVALGCAGAALAVSSMYGRRGLGVRLLALLCATAALAYVVAPAWNPMHVETWTTHLGRIWDAEVVDDGSSISIGYGSFRSPDADLFVGIPLKVSWLAKCLQALLWLVAATDTLAVVALAACSALALFHTSDNIDALASTIATLGLLALLALLGLFLWSWAHPGGGFGVALLGLINRAQGVLVVLGVAGLSVIGLGLFAAGAPPCREPRWRRAGVAVLRVVLLAGLALGAWGVATAQGRSWSSVAAALSGLTDGI